jgi:lipopolysaccharide export system protein LptA
MRTWVWAACAVAWSLAACAPRALSPGIAATPTRSSARPAAAAAPAAPAEPGRLGTYSPEAPAQVTADRMIYTQQGQVSVFQGRVRVTQGPTKMESPYLEVRAQDGRGTARQGVRLTDPTRGLTVTAQELDYTQTLDNAQARGNVRLDTHDDQGEALRLNCERLDWDNRAQTALARGAVRATYRDATATAESMQYLRAAQVLELQQAPGSGSPQPRVEQAGSTITGNVITLRLQERVYEAKGAARADIDTRTLSRPAPAGRKEQP